MSAQAPGYVEYRKKWRFQVNSWSLRSRCLVCSPEFELATTRWKVSLILVVSGHLPFGTPSLFIQIHILKGTDSRTEPGAIGICAVCVFSPEPKLNVRVTMALVNPSTFQSEKSINFSPHIFEMKDPNDSSWGSINAWKNIVDSYIQDDSIMFEMEVSFVMDANTPMAASSRAESCERTVQDLGRLLENPVHFDVIFEAAAALPSSSVTSVTSASSPPSVGAAVSAEPPFCPSIERIPAHKGILAARSEVFRAMFSVPMQEQKDSVVRIDDLSADTVRRLLRFIYTGNTTVWTWDMTKQNKLSPLGEYREALKTALISRNNLIKMARDNCEKARKNARKDTRNNF